MSKNTTIIIAITAGIIAGVAGMYIVSSRLPAKNAVTSGTQTNEAKQEKKVLYWKAPMDPNYIADKPGKSPMGMDLIPVYEGEDGGSEPGTVKIDPVTVQNIGVKVATIKRMSLKKTIRTVGTITYDEEKIYKLHTKIDGWVEKLYVNSTGEQVKKGDVLLEIYSPSLVSTQEEYLLALKYQDKMKSVGKGSMAELSRRRLEFWDVPEHQIKELEEKKTVIRALHIHSPATGIVVEKPVVEGMYVKPGMKLYTIADISQVWINAEIYEYELPWIKLGQDVEVTLASYPGKIFRGKVSFIYPFMDVKTRTNKVRLVFNNPGFLLKPDMYVNATLKPIISKDAIALPIEAVIRSGKRDIVIVERGEGKFSPRDVTLGAATDNYYEVIDGLNEGDVVVTSAQFLIDSESKLKEAINKMLKAKSKKTTEPDDMQGMDHEDMKGMDHEGMQGMDHEGMKGMDHEDMQGMDHEDMQGMDHEGMQGMDHEGMKGMDHEGMQGMDDEDMQGMDHEGMKGMDHEGMQGMDHE